uniref:NADH dehydrogenase subunit 4L n=1 Tax=Scirtothrips dorsalis TaxID=163899 RepID=A0A089N4K4_SCIDO|nr:NADH dehydrogenase subunit 4L [Scirtothrips dorsalis]
MLIFLFMYMFFNFFSFLSSLLLLEACSLILFFFSVYLMVFGFSMKFLLYYFVFIVSESAMGLSILVTTMKTFGSGNFRSMNISKF